MLGRGKTGCRTSTNIIATNVLIESLAEFRFAARADQLKDARAKVRKVATALGFDKETTDCIVFAVDEACANIIRHGYCEGMTGDIILNLSRNEHELVVRLTDFAEPVDVSSICARNLDEVRPGGLGVPLMNEIMDRVEYLDAPDNVGNILEMRKRLAAS